MNHYYSHVNHYYSHISHYYSYIRHYFSLYHWISHFIATSDTNIAQVCGAQGIQRLKEKLRCHAAGCGRDDVMVWMRSFWVI